MTMIENAPISAEMRDKLMADPAAILNDSALMAALAEATSPAQGEADVVDFRALAMQRLEDRLTRLEAAQAEILAASWQRINATEQTHRALLAAMDARSLSDLAGQLGGPVAASLGLAGAALLADEGALPLATGIALAEPGSVAAYLGSESRDIVQRRVEGRTEMLFGAAAGQIRSEAVIALHRLAPLPGHVALALGATEPDAYTPELGTDLLRVFGTGVARTVALLCQR